MILTFGTISRNNSIRLASSSTVSKAMPVMLPPGRLKLLTSPAFTGSAVAGTTIGIVAVAFLATRAVVLPPLAIMTATLSRTSSAAIAGNRSYWSSAQRNSIRTFFPSTRPSSPRPWRKESKACPIASGDKLQRNPITGICCASAARGQNNDGAATAPPTTPINSRRFIAALAQGQPSRPHYRIGGLGKPSVPTLPPGGIGTARATSRDTSATLPSAGRDWSAAA